MDNKLLAKDYRDVDWQNISTDETDGQAPCVRVTNKERHLIQSGTYYETPREAVNSFIDEHSVLKGSRLTLEDLSE